MTTMSVTEARAALPEILDRVSAGEEITLTRHGEAVAVVVRPDALRSRRAGESIATAERVRAMLADARGKRLAARGRLSAEQGEALLAEVQASRARR